jgi:hypothetical protein
MTASIFTLRTFLEPRVTGTAGGLDGGVSVDRVKVPPVGVLPGTGVISEKEGECGCTTDVPGRSHPSLLT